jgi:hypothetical protein
MWPWNWLVWQWPLPHWWDKTDRREYRKHLLVNPVTVSPCAPSSVTSGLGVWSLFGICFLVTSLLLRLYVGLSGLVTLTWKLVLGRISGVFIKSAIQDMTTQLVPTIQTAFMKGSRSKDRDLDRKSPRSLPKQAKSITSSSRRSVVARSYYVFT